MVTKECPLCGEVMKLRHREVIAHGVQIVGNFQFIDFAMYQQNLTTRVDQHGRVV